jgi:hypothetical protein
MQRVSLATSCPPMIPVISANLRVCVANFTRLYEQAAQALDKGNDSAYHKFKKVCSAYRLAAQNWEAFVGQ